jgi:hypothetical protein
MLIKKRQNANTIYIIYYFELKEVPLFFLSKVFLRIQKWTFLNNQEMSNSEVPEIVLKKGVKIEGL